MKKIRLNIFSSLKVKRGLKGSNVLLLKSLIKFLSGLWLVDKGASVTKLSWNVLSSSGCFTLEISPWIFWALFLNSRQSPWSSYSLTSSCQHRESNKWLWCEGGGGILVKTPALLNRLSAGAESLGNTAEVENTWLSLEVEQHRQPGLQP